MPADTRTLSGQISGRSLEMQHEEVCEACSTEERDVYGPPGNGANSIEHISVMQLMTSAWLEMYMPRQHRRWLISSKSAV